MKNIFFIAAIVAASTVHAQVSKVNLQASGLTCSMCSNAINKALKTIDFVDKVDANIKTSTFVITFKPNSAIDFDKLKNKVEDAGFFVSGFLATVNFDKVEVVPGKPVTVGDKVFQFVNAESQALTGFKTVRIINKGFVSAKEFKKNAVTAAEAKGTKVYHVIISSNA